MNPVTALSLGRIGIGVASLTRPDLVQSAMGMRTDNPLLTQWFGSREIALGAATLLAGGSARRSLALICIAVDGADAVTAYQGVDRQLVARPLGLALTGIATAAVVAGLVGVRVRNVASLTRAERKALATA